MKAYRGVDGRIRIFRPNMNMNRMNLSAKRSGLPTFDGDEFIKCMSRLVSIDQEWVPHTEKASLYIRPTLIGIDPTLGVASSDSALLYTILSPVGGYFDKKDSEKSQAVSLLADPQYTRAWPGGVGDRKMGSNYAPTIHVQKEASNKGLQQVLWLYGPEHQLTEVGTMNIFLLFVNEQGGLYLFQCTFSSSVIYDFLQFKTKIFLSSNRTRTDYPTTEWFDLTWNHTRLNFTPGQTMGRLQSHRRYN